MAKKVEKKEEDKVLDELLDAIPEAETEEVEETTEVVEEPVEEPVEEAEEESLFEEAIEEHQEELEDADLELSEEERASLDASRNYGEEPVEEAEEEVLEESVEEAVEEQPVVEESVEEVAAEEQADAEVVDEKPAKKHHYVRNGLLILGAAASLATAFVGGEHMEAFVWGSHIKELEKDEEAFDVVINTLGEAGITLDDITQNGIKYSADVNGKPAIVYYSYADKKTYAVDLTNYGYEMYQEHQDGKVALDSKLFDGRESKRVVVVIYLNFLDNTVEKLKAENAQLKTDLNKANFDLAAAQKANNELKKLIAELNKKFEGEEAAENTDVEDLKQHIDELTAENEANKQALKEINAKIEEALGKELTDSDDKDVAKANVDELIAAAKAKDQTIQDKDAEIAALKEKINTNEEIVNAITTSDGKTVVTILYTLSEQNDHTNEGEQLEVGQD